MKIVRAIVAGERDDEVLSALIDRRCKASAPVISAALTGDYQPEHVLALTQALALYDFYQRCIHDCDAEIEKAVALMNLSLQAPEAPMHKAKHRTRQPNEVNFDVRAAMYQLTGTDLTQIHGIGPFLALRLVAECGTDLSRWKTAMHLTTWLTLAPVWA